MGSADYSEIEFPGGHIGIYVSGKAQQLIPPRSPPGSPPGNSTQERYSRKTRSTLRGGLGPKRKGNQGGLSGLFLYRERGFLYRPVPFSWVFSNQATISSLESVMISVVLRAASSIFSLYSVMSLVWPARRSL